MCSCLCCCVWYYVLLFVCCLFVSLFMFCLRVVCFVVSAVCFLLFLCRWLFVCFCFYSVCFVFACLVMCVCCFLCFSCCFCFCMCVFLCVYLLVFCYIARVGIKQKQKIHNRQQWHLWKYAIGWKRETCSGLRPLLQNVTLFALCCLEFVSWLLSGVVYVCYCLRL